MGHHHHHKYSFGNFIHDISPATKGIGHLFDKGITAVDHIGVAGVHEVGSVSKSLINKTGGLLDKISLPIIVVGGAVLFFVLTKK
jgi:hypothetical protein